MVLAISFVEAPLKFRAPGVTLQIGLGIGRLVFRAFNGCELALAVVVAASSASRHHLSLVAAAVAAVILLAQVSPGPAIRRRPAGPTGHASRAHWHTLGWGAVKVEGGHRGHLAACRVRRSLDAAGNPRVGHRRRRQAGGDRRRRLRRRAVRIRPPLVGEHVVDGGPIDVSPLPHADDGHIAVPATADWINPIIGSIQSAVAGTAICPSSAYG